MAYHLGEQYRPKKGEEYYPLWDSFKGILTRVYSNFKDNHEKIRTLRPTNEIPVRAMTSFLSDFENKTSLPLVGAMHAMTYKYLYD